MCAVVSHLVCNTVLSLDIGNKALDKVLLLIPVSDGLLLLQKENKKHGR